MKCKHPKNMRQAVAGGIDCFSYSPYGVICVACGAVLFSGYIHTDKESQLNFALKEK